jgi:ABC-type transport system involved in multi-copper enzyme maturation permease subunit
MKAPALLERLDDWINPIVVKELRQAVQSRLVVTALFLFLGMQLFSVGLSLMLRDARGGTDAIDWRAGAHIFPWLQSFLLATCLLLIPAYTTIRLAAERSDTNVDLLFISTLKPRSIIAGKFLAALVLAMLVFSACAPFMTFTYLLRGLDMPTVLVMLGMDVLAVLFGTQVALFVAAVPANRALKFLLTVSVFIGLAILFGSGIGLVSEITDSGVDFTASPSDTWTVIGVAVLLVACNVGLLFCWTVALISPPSSNRAPAGRLFLVAGWLAIGAAAALWSGNFRGGGHHAPMLTWCLLAVFLLCVQLIISTNERTTWGPRVARTVPRNVLLRLPAFLFSSGAAGGMLLALGLIGLTLLANELWRERYPTMPGADGSLQAGRAAALLALYVYGYAVTAVLVRTYVLKERVPRQLTWVVMVALTCIGSAIPYLIAYLFFGDELRYSAGREWWLVANPFVVLYEVSETRGVTQVVEWAYDFTIVWGVLVTGLVAPWVYKQVVRFRPLAGRPAPPSAPAAAPISEPATAPIQAG